MLFDLWSKLSAGLRSNWPLVILVAAFILLIPLHPAWVWLARGAAPDPFARYVAAVRDSAVLTPDNIKGRPLAKIDKDQPKVAFVTFKAAARPPQNPLASPLWVALPGDLKQLCVGEPDAPRALRQILGLQPTSEPRLVYEIVAESQDVFRPCVSHQKPDLDSCAMEAPKAPEDDSKLRQAYQDLAFVADQLLTSHQVGFRQKYEGKPGDYPYEGMPFTGLGWTYDWRPSSKTHAGVTEFVIRQGATIEVKSHVEPQAFCAAQK